MKSMVLVRWSDAQDHADTWVDEKDATNFGEADCTVQSVGFLISKTAKYVTIGSDWDEVDKNYGTVRKIPTTVVLSIEDVTVPTQT